MINEKIDLYEYFGMPHVNKGGYLQTFVPHKSSELEPKLRPVMLVIPGGAYKMLSEREGEPVALKFMANGYSSFVLEYSIETPYPVPLLEACMAVIYIRENAEKYSVDAAHVGAVGFSAGGHLAGMLANIYDEKEIVDILGKRAALARLDAVILSYPVVTLYESTHGDTRSVITGGDAKLRDKLSIEKRVNKNSVPAFIWHTVEDDCVPVENSMLLAEAYKKANVPFALHLFEKGWHGLSICSAETHNQTENDEYLAHVGKWFYLAVDWLASRGFCVSVAR